MRLRSNKTINHNPGLFDSLNTSISSTELCSDEDSDGAVTGSSAEDLEKMYSELRGLLKDQSVPIANFVPQSNIKISITSHNDNRVNQIIDEEEEFDAVTESMKQINETKSLTGILKETIINSDFIYNEEIEDYLSEDDSDYNPSIELEKTINDTELKHVKDIRVFRRR